MVYQLKHKLELTEQPNPAYVALSAYELVSQMLWQDAPHDFAVRQWQAFHLLGFNMMQQWDKLPQLFDDETINALGAMTDGFISFAESITHPNNAIPDHSLEDIRKAHAKLEKLNFKSKANEHFNSSDQY